MAGQSPPATPDTASATEWQRTKLFMRRPWLDDLPDEPALPTGTQVRRADASDSAALATLLTRAFGEPWDAERVRRDLTEAADVEETYVVASAGGLLATASVRLLPDRYPGSGYVHWVAADPDVQGKGLGTLVTLRVLRHFQAGGLCDAVLETNDFRVPAVRTYLRLGFVPEPTDRDEQVRWARLLPRLVR